ncbi:MAG: hypothetical protein LQ337_008615, partial [Flavoplaca oasis]
MRTPLAMRPAPGATADDSVYDSFYNHSTAPRINSNVVLTSALRKEYPNLHLTITPTYSSNFLGFASAGHASALPTSTSPASISPDSVTCDALSSGLKWRRYIPPLTHGSSSPGVLVDDVKFGRYIYTWREYEYILYVVEGANSLYDEAISYLLGPSAAANDALLLAAGAYRHQLHEEIWVFNNGYWSANHKLWQEVQKSSWDDVILAEEMKKSIKGEMEKFFGSEERYKRLKVPWKRGIIYYGPPGKSYISHSSPNALYGNSSQAALVTNRIHHPGNGKTISIKAMMHTLSLYSPNPIPTLYVRSLTSYYGPEYSIQTIFRKARSQAPCLLVFEDLDSLVTDRVRSYFLNEVDGLESNDGILMVGSTNHLERLDPGIRKRPSRFDRKFLFDLPDEHERILYCEYWRRKLGADDDNNEENTREEKAKQNDKDHDDSDIEFPHLLCKPIASITRGFSFAYIQEAFVASLLAIAANDGAGDDMVTDEAAMGAKLDSEDDLASMLQNAKRQVGGWDEDEGKGLDEYLLWRVMKKQVRVLREELEDVEFEVGVE